MMSKESLITVAMLALITYTMGLSFVSQAYPAEQTIATLSSAGSIQIQASAGIGIYTNSQCTAPATALAWGTLEPGGSQAITIYIKNEGSTPITLSMQTLNFVPTVAGDYLSINWNYGGNSIVPDAVLPVTLTLGVDESIEGVENFNFDVVIIGNS